MTDHLLQMNKLLDHADGGADGDAGGGACGDAGDGVVGEVHDVLRGFLNHHLLDAVPCALVCRRQAQAPHFAIYQPQVQGHAAVDLPRAWFQATALFALELTALCQTDLHQYAVVVKPHLHVAYDRFVQRWLCTEQYPDCHFAYTFVESETVPHAVPEIQRLVPYLKLAQSWRRSPQDDSTRLDWVDRNFQVLVRVAGNQNGGYS